MSSYTDRPTAVYRFFDHEGRLLYVGITGRLSSRFRFHERNAPWWPLQRSMAATWRDSRDEALADERLAIESEKPRFNVAGNRANLGGLPEQGIALHDAVAREVRGEVARFQKKRREVGAVLGLNSHQTSLRMNGFVPFSDSELTVLAAFLGISVERFQPRSVSA